MAALFKEKAASWQLHVGMRLSFFRRSLLGVRRPRLNGNQGGGVGIWGGVQDCTFCSHTGVNEPMPLPHRCPQGLSKIPSPFPVTSLLRPPEPDKKPDHSHMPRCSPNYPLPHGCGYMGDPYGAYGGGGPAYNQPMIYGRGPVPAGMRMVPMVVSAMSCQRPMWNGGIGIIIRFISGTFSSLRKSIPKVRDAEELEALAAKEGLILAAKWCDRKGDPRVSL